MNIIYVGDCGPKPSGAPISCDQLTRALANRGWRVRVLAPQLGATDAEVSAFDAARPEIETHHYPVPRHFFNPFERPPDDWEVATKAGVAEGLEHLISRVYLEAQACAKTLLASDVAGAREVVRHGETGLLFRQADSGDQAEKTLLAAGAPALRAEIGSRARKYVEQHHNIDQAVEEYMALLQLQCER